MVQKQIILQFAASSQGKSMSRSNREYGLTPKKHWFFLPNKVFRKLARLSHSMSCDTGCLILSPPLKTSITRYHTNYKTRAERTPNGNLFRVDQELGRDMKQSKVEADQDAAIISDAVSHSTLASSLTSVLPRATLSRIEVRSQHNDMPEQKRPCLPVDFDDDLSEFERARRTSKTWSMGQD